MIVLIRQVCLLVDVVSVACINIKMVCGSSTVHWMDLMTHCSSASPTFLILKLQCVLWICVPVKAVTCCWFWQIVLYQGWKTSSWPSHLKHVKIADLWHCVCWLTVRKHSLLPLGTTQLFLWAGLWQLDAGRLRGFSHWLPWLGPGFFRLKMSLKYFSTILVWLQILGVQFSYQCNLASHASECTLQRQSCY